jgi:perosamine synthetase
MDSLMSIAKEFSIHIIEDAAEAHGAIYHGKSVGGFGAMATFSFFGNKIITTGEGGAITTDSDDYAEYARFLRDHGMSRTKRYWYEEVGYNYRMTNLQAALGVAQINQIHNFIMERDNIINEYKKHLEPAGLILNPIAPHIRPVNWITCVLLDKPDSIIRDKILAELKNFGIETRPFFYPITSLPMYKNNVNSVSENLSARGLNLPTFAGISKEQIKFISRNLIDAISKHS